MIMWLCDLKLIYIKVVSLVVEGYCFLKDIFIFWVRKWFKLCYFYSNVVFKLKLFYYICIVDWYKIIVFFLNYSYNI